MNIEEFWDGYKQKFGSDKEYCSAYYFCDNKDDANELAELVLAGKKKATASNYACYKHEDEPLPKPGELNIITDFDDNPLCVIETTNVEIIPFKDVSAEFAALEGEGDLSLEFWRRVHKRFFTEELKEIGLEFNEDIQVVCESFKVVYK